MSLDVSTSLKKTLILVRIIVMRTHSIFKQCDTFNFYAVFCYFELFIYLAHFFLIIIYIPVRSIYTYSA